MLIFFPVFLMEFEIKMDFDLYTGIISYNVVTAFMPPLWAEQRRYNSNTTTTVIIIINVFCRSPTWEVSIVLFVLWWWKGAAGCNCICWIEGVCSLEHRQKCVQGRLDSSWMLFQPFLGKMSFVPAVFKKKKTKVFLLQEGNLWWAKVNLNSLVVCCLFIHCSSEQCTHLRLVSWFYGICEKFWPLFLQVCRAASVQGRLRGCESQNSEICGSVCREQLCTVKFCLCGREEVFGLEHSELKMSSITIYLLVKLFLFPLWSKTENSPKAASYPSKDTAKSFEAKNFQNTKCSLLLLKWDFIFLG